MQTKYRLILVDASGYLFRAYHALPKLTNSSGEPTGALLGVLNMLRKLIEEHRPEYLGVIFDAASKSFRNDLYPDYKAQRPPMPDDLRAQIQPLQSVIQAMGLPLLVIPEVEADDVIGTLATQAAAAGIPTLISTGDKDMAQLVGEHVTLVNTMTETLLDAAGVREKFGVPPERIVDYLSLMGDSADNVPGVPKCGPKTAAKWIAEYGDLDGVIANAGSVRGQVGENLRAALDQLPLSRQLTTIKRDVLLDRGPTDLHRTPPEVETLRGWYERFESRRLLATLKETGTHVDTVEAPKPAAPTPVHYDLILTQDAFDDWMTRLESAALVAFDTETTSLDDMRAELVGLSFAIEPGQAAYVPLAHRYPGAPDQLNRESVLARLKPLLEDANRAKVGQNLKYDMSVLARHAIVLRGIAHDTMLASYVLDSTATRHNMDALAKKYLDYDTVHFEDIAGKGVRQITFDQIPLEPAGHYAAEDADITLRLHRTFWPKLEAIPTLAHLYQSIEMPLVPILSRLERTGVRIDSGLLAQQSQDLGRRIAGLEIQAYETAGRRFNMSSPKQIGAIFFDELNLPVVSRTPKGAPSTSEEVLERLAAEGHQLPGIILQHRSLSKLKSTYTDKLPQMVNPETGRVHTSYHQAVAATGRLSSSDPNLQNIPIRTEEGRLIRRAFIPEPDCRMLAADYSQIELRIMAHLSGDERLLAAFASGQDIHRATAAEILGLTPEAVTSEQRRSAKAINFGLIYGMSAFGLARQLGIARGAAQEYVERYFNRYPGIKVFMERIRAQAHEDRYVETLFGRRLYLTEINHSNQGRRAAAERTAINAPMQGTAADIIKRAMVAVDHWLQSDRPPVRMIMQVHDELVFEVAEDAIEMASDRIRCAMESAAALAVPLSVDIGVGANWDEAH
jgi:DNA polymerase-1